MASFERQVVLEEIVLNKTPEQLTAEEFFSHFFNSVSL